MPNHSPAGNTAGTGGIASSTVAVPVAETLDPDHEYSDSTETKLDHTRPPHHDTAVKNVPHQDVPQISIGDD